MTLTLAITTYNRIDYLRESFEQVIDHPRIGEIILMDDCSKPEIFEQIQALSQMSPKIKILRQAQNRGMSRNKADAISFATNEWVIIFDSDNVITGDYIDAIPLDLSPTVIYQPEFAKPKFDFRLFSRLNHTFINKYDVKLFAKYPMFWVMLNACNYVVNRDEYLRVYQENPEHKASDTVWMAYLWLRAPNSFQVVYDMQYEHRIHDKSGFLAECDYNMKQAEKVKKMIMAL